MEAETFSIGTAYKRPTRKPKPRHLKQVWPQSRSSINRYQRPQIWDRPVIFQTWYLLPRSTNFNVNLLLDRNPNFKETVNYIKSKRPKRRFYNTFNIQVIHDLIPNASDYLLGITKAQANEAMRLAFLNESVRRRFKALVNRWRRSTFTQANEEDLITVERPVKEVIVYDWTERKTYHFEASTILRCITRRILNHDVLFIQPLEPVNPYTNLPFTLGNMQSIIDQLRVHGFSHWTLEALRSAEYNWEYFKIAHEKPLQLDALKKTFLEKTDEARDLLFDFIDSEYNIHGADFESDLYRWALVNAASSPHIQCWNKLCYTYYYSSIMYKDIPIKAKTIYTRALKTAYNSGCFSIPTYLSNRMAQWESQHVLQVLGSVVGPQA